MIKKYQSRAGKAAWRMPYQDPQALNGWVQSLLHAVHGEEEGERKYRSFRLVDALELWSNQTHIEQ